MAQKLLLKLVALVLGARVDRPAKLPARSNDSLWLSVPIDPGLEDLLRGRGHSQLFFYCDIDDGGEDPGGGKKKVILEEWRLMADCSDDQGQGAAMVLRSIASIVHCLPLSRVSPAKLKFSLDQAIDGSLAIDQPLASEAESPLYESFLSVELPYGLGTVVYRRELPEHLKAAKSRQVDVKAKADELIGPRPVDKASDPSAEQDTHKRAPSLPRSHSFESVHLEASPASSPKTGSSLRNQQGSEQGAEALPDAAEITLFLKHLEARPSLPGLFGDAWLQEEEIDQWWPDVQDRWERIQLTQHDTAARGKDLGELSLQDLIQEQ